jgi:heterodisulfide reductase subunit A-like polyferredoxin
MCAVACWSNAIEMKNFTDRQIEAMIEAARPEAPAAEKKQKV